MSSIHGIGHTNDSLVTLTRHRCWQILCAIHLCVWRWRRTRTCLYQWWESREVAPVCYKTWSLSLVTVMCIDVGTVSWALQPSQRRARVYNCPLPGHPPAPVTTLNNTTHSPDTGQHLIIPRPPTRARHRRNYCYDDASSNADILCVFVSKSLCSGNDYMAWNMKGFCDSENFCKLIQCRAERFGYIDMVSNI